MEKGKKGPLSALARAYIRPGGRTGLALSRDTREDKSNASLVREGRGWEKDASPRSPSLREKKPFFEGCFLYAFLLSRERHYQRKDSSAFSLFIYRKRKGP